MEKKTKLTISGSAKKSIKNIEIAKTQSKNAVVIEKQTGKFPNRGGSFRPSPGRLKPTSSLPNLHKANVTNMINAKPKNKNIEAGKNNPKKVNDNIIKA